MKKTVLMYCYMGLLLFPDLYGQGIVKKQKIYETERNHLSIVPHPNSLFLSGKYEECLQNLLKDTAKTEDYKLYYMASCYAKKEQVDSAFFYLNCYIDSSWDDRVIIVDKTWDILRRDTLKWTQITNKIENLYLQDLESFHNKELALELFYWGIFDQKYRLYVHSLQQFPDEIERKKDQEITESLYSRFNKILKQYGFPAISLVGLLGSTNAFFIFQHSHFDLVCNYHYIVEAYQKKEIMPQWYAMATDRYLSDMGKKQIYGTQFVQGSQSKKKYSDKCVLWPIEDFKHVNERRKEMGFSSTVEEHVNAYGYYIPPEYYEGKGKVRWVSPGSFHRQVRTYYKKRK